VQFLYPLPDNALDATGGDLQVNYGPVVVPPDFYFMMGDNRDNSEDSRYWGFMPRAYVKGKALFIYFSLGENGVRWSRMLHQIH
jgi:signal peptidase I